MLGNYTCKNCGHTDFYYGSPLWVQRCRKCGKVIGLKLNSGERGEGDEPRNKKTDRR